jgi:phosphomevalonate kinase
MSNIRREFYDAINKANVQKPKKTIKKFSPKVELTLEKQIQNILNESDSAILDCKVTINNQSLIDYLYEMTKKDTETIELEKMINQELETINKLRDEARRKYRELNRMNEFTAYNPSAASSSAAGAGGGGTIFITKDNTTNSYVVDGYVEDYLL